MGRPLTELRHASSVSTSSRIDNNATPGKAEHLTIICLLFAETARIQQSQLRMIRSNERIACFDNILYSKIGTMILPLK